MSGALLSILGAALDVQAVTVGVYGSAPNRIRGYDPGVSIGSISDGTSNIYGGASILDLYWNENGGGGAEYVEFRVNGTQANSGWTRMNVNGTNFSRSSATFTATGGVTFWQWPGTTTNPFGISGSVQVTFF